MKAMGVVVKNKVSGTVIIYKLANIAAFLSRRAKTFQIAEMAVRLIY